ncbi:MAG: tetratricopeptide repeat protein [Candidatus Omnitrophica bacterium]|nr:tetratricopeptide repeat protein [Candidatus Omnitrophota bacterium]
MNPRSIEEIRRLLNEALTFNKTEQAKELAREGFFVARQKELLGPMEYFQGELALIEDDFDVALKHFDKAIQFDPADGEVYNDKAICLAELGYEQEALDCFDQGIEAAVAYAPLYNNKGWLLIQMGRYEQALESCRKSLKYDPGSPVVYANIAAAQEKMNDIEGALSNLERALVFLAAEDQEARDWILSRIENLKGKQGEGENDK